VLTSFMEALPGDLEEAAYVDGATPFQVFYKVLLPLLLPGLVTTGLLAFIAAWNEYLFALSFIQDPDKYTVPIAITSFVGESGQRVPAAVGHDHGRDDHHHRAARRARADLPALHPGGPHRRRREGLIFLPTAQA
jgi:hypothetical protein